VDSPNPILAWRLDPLPDFLVDHTLAAVNPSERLHEVVSRWVQFVGALWRWRDQACFAIRYVSNGKHIAVAFLATPHDAALISELFDDISVLLRTHQLLDADVPTAWVEPETLQNPVIFEVRQFSHRGIWQIPDRYSRITSEARRRLVWVPEAEWKHCRVPFPWWAPGGPFLLPMEKLISQKKPVSLTAYLQPTVLTSAEAEWLEFMARIAQSSSEHQEHAADAAVGQRKVDPAASLVGRLFMANYRRLADKPFLVTVHCAASAGDLLAARSVAGTMESIVYETPFDRPQQDDNRLPSAAEVLGGSDDVSDCEATRRHQQYVTLRFPSVVETDPLHRLAYLADARGASTVFRLPINVRGGVPGVTIAQRPPDFHPGPREEELSTDEIILGFLHQGGVAKVSQKQFTKHVLVTGFTGSGKTTTVLGMIHRLRQAGVPMLAIESAKQEYRGLLGVPLFVHCQEPLWVFTVGNEAAAPLRLNPFELLPGVRVEAHISRLQTCFEAALPPIGPLASMIGQTLVEIYERAGWRLTDIAPDVGEPMYLRFPTMLDFFSRMERIVEERGYEGDVRSNVTAAVLGRIKPLTIGSKGLMFRDVRRHEPGQLRLSSLVTAIFSRSVVVELNDLNLEDKALMVMFLLTFLREYREQHASHDGRLLHITVVEEAHNVLENVKSVGTNEGGAADTRHKAVQAFSNLLSEIRALGEGVIIADQSPEKLAPDAMRNTNIQIAHQLRDASDRDAVARAMIMDNEQRDFLGKLSPGHAALYVTGLQKATFIRVPRYYPNAGGPDSSETRGVSELLGYGYRAFQDTEVRELMLPVVGEYVSGPFDSACRECPVRTTCDYRKPVMREVVLNRRQDRFSDTVGRYRRSETDDKGKVIADVVDECVATATVAVLEPNRDVAWCVFVHLWHGDPYNWNEPFPDDARELIYQSMSHRSLLGDRITTTDFRKNRI
jgi:hypothetical protein